MKRSYRAFGLPASALFAVLAAGCNTSTTNDDAMGKSTAPPSSSTPAPKSYADFAQSQHEQTAKKAADKGTSKRPPAGKESHQP